MNTQQHTQTRPKISPGDIAFARQMHSETERALADLRKNISILLTKYRGQFVALSGGEVLDKDKDELALVERVAKNWANRFVLIHEVTDETPQRLSLETGR